MPDVGSSMAEHMKTENEFNSTPEPFFAGAWVFCSVVMLLTWQIPPCGRNSHQASSENFTQNVYKTLPDCVNAYISSYKLMEQKQFIFSLVHYALKLSEPI